MAPKASPQELKTKFKALDKNGDNCLDYKEFSALLKKGDPSLSESDLKSLFKKADKSGDGVVQFDEFVDYLYGQAGPADARSGDARRQRLHDDNSSHDAGNEALWEGVANVFKAFVGQDCDGKEFVKLCKDCHFLNKKFTTTQVDLIFSGSVVKGQRRMAFDQFKTACGKLAKGKGMSVEELQQAMIEVGGPVFAGTQADNVRFHDDKSSYTGAHVFNEKHGDAVGGGERGGDVRHERLSAAGAVTDLGDDGLWGQVQGAFDAFVGKDCDGKEFVKLCKDCNLFVPKKFTVTDCDLVFAGSVVKGQRRLTFDGFKTACGKIAQKRGCAVTEIQNIIVEAGGPHFAGTQADNVRFHDDKSTYTGAHTQNSNHGPAGGAEHGGGRHDRLSQAGAVSDFGNDGLWDPISGVFNDFVGKDCDGKEFVKLCKDCSLFNRKFSVTDADLVFSGSVVKGQRRLDFEGFKTACGKIANKKGCAVTEIQEDILAAGGPQYAGTVAEYSKFHDDKSTYTGAHYGK